MPPLYILPLLSLATLFSYFFSLTPYINYAPQILATLTIIFVLLVNRKSYILNLILISLSINLIVFITGGLNSSLFFLIYFLLFVLAFQIPPVLTLSYSLVLIIFLSQSLNSAASLLPLLSLLLITPLAWFIGRLNKQIAQEETDVFLWHSLKFKTGISKILDSSSFLLSQPQLTPTQKEHAKSIRDSARYLLNSSKKLENEIDQDN